MNADMAACHTIHGLFCMGNLRQCLGNGWMALYNVVPQPVHSVKRVAFNSMVSVWSARKSMYNGVGYTKQASMGPQTSAQHTSTSGMQ